MTTISTEFDNFDLTVANNFNTVMLVINNTNK